MSKRNLLFTDLNQLCAPYILKWCLAKLIGQIFTLRSPNGQKGKKKLNARNSCLNANQQEFCGYLRKIEMVSQYIN